MIRTLSLASVAVLSFTACAVAQSPATDSNLSKPSAYQGVAQPSSEPILATRSPQDDAAPARTIPAPPAQAAPVKTPAATIPPARAQNPDYDILTTPVPDETPVAEVQKPTLKSHGFNPDANIVTSVPLAPNQLPEGTPMHARLVEQLSADTITPGTPFSAQLTSSVTYLGNTVIPVGSYIHGRVTYVSAGRRIGGQSTMRLTPEEVVLPDGTHYHFRGIVTQTAGSNTRAGAEGDVINRDHPGRTAAEYGLAAGSGAVLGAVVGGPVGAGVGSAIGAGVMTVHWLRERNAAVLPINSQVTFALSAPLTLTPAALPPSASIPGPAAYTSPAAPAYVEPTIQN